MAAPKELTRLVKNFDRNLASYTSGAYNEAQVRAEFIDPMFELLGWDVQNKAGNAEAYKDVIHEDAIQIGGTTRAPDYCFRIGGARKFFLEAKKPSVSIKDEPTPAYQLRRYAWSAKLPLSILSDFAELAVYDCRVKPEKTDKPAIARINYLTYDAYPSKWDEIATVFSKDAVLKGSFDRFAEEKKGKKGTAAVDAEFLKEIERWRELLARNIALRNPHLSIRELNEAVQRTIDRIVFLRICEDRGIETDRQFQLQFLLNGANTYRRLFELFQRADERYNSGLFHFQREKGFVESPDTLTPGLVVDDKVLKDIVSNLYYPDSPYEFSVLPADILGQVYEQFLGKVIRLTAGHRAVVEDKPEVKKAGGVYYTPTYIVDYIVEHTVGELLKQKTPKQAADLKILDPACGSGSFLLGAYQRLLDWHRDWYVNDGPDKYTRPRKGGQPALFQAGHGEWRLTTAERKRILLNSIFGVDIDPQAVEVTKLSLLLKVLEGESEESINAQLKLFHQRALPDLGSNIRCGNSLIGSDFFQGRQGELFDDEEALRVNPFDWDKGFPEIFARPNPGFDVVVGNPPYDVLEKDRGKTSWPHAALTDYAHRREALAPALGGKLNLYRFFVVQSLLSTRGKGKFGMIVPMSILGDISTGPTRAAVLRMCSTLSVDAFPQKDNASRRVFELAKLSTCILVADRRGKHQPQTDAIEVRTYPWNSFLDAPKRAVIRTHDLTLVDPDVQPIPTVSQPDWTLCLKLHARKDVSALGRFDDYNVRRGEINQTIYREYILRGRSSYRLLKGAEVGRYVLHQRMSQGNREWFDESTFLRDHDPKPFVRDRRIATQRITGVDERLRVVATILEPPAYFADSTNSISRSPGCPHRLEYLLGLLNSHLIQLRFKITSTNNNVGTNELDALPIRRIEFSDGVQQAQHNRMVDLVDRMLALHSKLAVAGTDHEKTVVQRQIDATDREIDQLVYELYGLTDEEIKIVEHANDPSG